MILWRRGGVKVTLIDLLLLLSIPGLINALENSVRNEPDSKNSPTNQEVIVKTVRKSPLPPSRLQISRKIQGQVDRAHFQDGRALALASNNPVKNVTTTTTPSPPQRLVPRFVPKPRKTSAYDWYHIQDIPDEEEEDVTTKASTSQVLQETTRSNTITTERPLNQEITRGVETSTVKNKGSEESEEKLSMEDSEEFTDRPRIYSSTKRSTNDLTGNNVGASTTNNDETTISTPAINESETTVEAFTESLPSTQTVTSTRRPETTDAPQVSVDSTSTTVVLLDEKTKITEGNLERSTTESSRVPEISIETSKPTTDITEGGERTSTPSTTAPEIAVSTSHNVETLQTESSRVPEISTETSKQITDSTEGVERTSTPSTTDKIVQTTYNTGFLTTPAPEIAISTTHNVERSQTESSRVPEISTETSEQDLRIKGTTEGVERTSTPSTTAPEVAISTPHNFERSQTESSRVPEISTETSKQITDNTEGVERTSTPSTTDRIVETTYNTGFLSTAAPEVAISTTRNVERSQTESSLVPEISTLTSEQHLRIKDTTEGVESTPSTTDRNGQTTYYTGLPTPAPELAITTTEAKVIDAHFDTSSHPHPIKEEPTTTAPKIDSAFVKTTTIPEVTEMSNTAKPIQFSTPSLIVPQDNLQSNSSKNPESTTEPAPKWEVVPIPPLQRFKTPPVPVAFKKAIKKFKSHLKAQPQITNIMPSESNLLQKMIQQEDFGKVSLKQIFPQFHHEVLPESKEVEVEVEPEVTTEKSSQPNPYAALAYYRNIFIPPNPRLHIMPKKHGEETALKPKIPAKIDLASHPFPQTSFPNSKVPNPYAIKS